MHLGQVVADRFRLDRIAGSGAMGEVFQARDLSTGRLVAVKSMRVDGGDAQRFLREARVLAALRHPAIVEYVAHGGAAGSEHFLVMEWLEGEDLAARLRRGRLSVAESVALVSRVADALAVVHGQGVVHRDIKPSNLFLASPCGEVKMIDFGVAKVSAGTGFQTGTGAVIGTPAYMAPEQARGAQIVDARSDVFALGCVLFECLTGRPAFEGTSAFAVLAKILLEDPPRASQHCEGIAPALDALVDRMLAKDPADRPADGAALVRDIEHLGPLEPPTGMVSACLPQSRLSQNEQRLVSIVLAAPPVPHGEAATEPALESAPMEAPVGRRLDGIVSSASGFRMEQLRDGSVLVMVTGVKTATDQAALAARAALALRAARPWARLAVATGRAVIGDRAPVGEVIERAAAYLRDGGAPSASTEDGTPIRLDDVTAGLLDARFEVHHDADRAFLVVERPLLDRTRRLLGKPTPCVGRDRELATLRAICDECFEDSVARVVLVTAPPGVGKSRLLLELLSGLESHVARPQSWFGRGDPMSAGSAFGMLAPALRSAAGIDESDALAARQAKLRVRLARATSDRAPAWTREPRERERVVQFLGESIGVAFPDDGDTGIQLRAARHEPRLMADQLARAWEDFVAAESADEPLLIALDDLHWGDQPSVTVIHRALARLRDRPLMVIALARPEVHDVFPRLWADRDVNQIRLSPLSTRAAARLVHTVLGSSVDTSTADALVAHADGNALYLEELIRAAASGRGNIPPGTVLAMLALRLEALPEDARRVLRAASIFGGEFSNGDVDLLVASDLVPRTEAVLSDLVDREILVRRDVRTGVPDYDFRHALVRDAAYAMLTDRDQVLGHQLVARGLENAGGRDPRVVAKNAHHEECAAQSLVHLGDADGAAGAFAKAALLFASAGIFELAVAPILRALELADLSLHDSAELVAWLGMLATAASAERRITSDLTALAGRVLPRIDDAGSLAHRVSARVGFARALGAINVFDDAYKMLEDAFALAGNERHFLSDTLAVEIEMVGRSGDFSRGIRAVERLEELGLVTNSRALLSIAYMRAAGAGDVVSALRALDAAQHLDRPDDLIAAATREKQRVLIYMCTGDYRAAVAASFRAIDLARTAGLRYDVGAALHNLGDAYRRIGDIRGAYAALAESKEIAESIGNQRLVRLNRMHLAYLDGMNNIADADRLLRDLIRDAEHQGFLTDNREGRFLLGLLLANLGRNDEARGELESLLAISMAQSDQGMAAESRELLAKL